MASVCIVRQHHLLPHARVGREIQSLAQAGHEVDVVCLRAPGEARFERRGRVTFRRLSIPRRGGSLVRYVFEHLGFFAVVAVLLTVRQLKRRYAVVQVNSVPETLVFATLVPKLLGARIVVDLHEPMPEFFASRFGLSAGHPLVRIVARMEQATIRFAHAAITCTRPMRDAFIARGAQPDKIEVVHDGADEHVFTPDVQVHGNGSRNGFTLICHGTVEERYGLDTVIRAVALLKPELPDLRFEVVGQGSYLPALEALARELEVEDRVHFSREFISPAALVSAIAAADAGVVAMKRDPFRDLTLCGKLFDFITMRKPTIASRTRSVEEYFDESSLHFFTSDDPTDLARAIRDLHAQPELRRKLVEGAVAAGEPYRWPHQRERYLAVVEREIDRSRAR